MNRFFVAALAVTLIASQTVMAADKKVEAKMEVKALQVEAQTLQGWTKAGRWTGQSRCFPG